MLQALSQLGKIEDKYESTPNIKHIIGMVFDSGKYIESKLYDFNASEYSKYLYEGHDASGKPGLFLTGNIPLQDVKNLSDANTHSEFIRKKILWFSHGKRVKNPRLFQAGINFKQIGPVQFAIGQSLNTMKEDTDIIRIGMTSLVPNTRNEAGISKGGSFGEKWIVRYAFIQHHGFVNNNIAKNVNLAETDVTAMLNAMWNGTDMLTTTSKFGQKSRLLIKVNYKSNGYIGDLDSDD